MSSDYPSLLLIVPAIQASAVIYIAKPLTNLARRLPLRFNVILESRVSLAEVRASDMVLMCRNIEPDQNWILQECLAQHIPLVYDLDDDLWNVPMGLPYSEYHHDPRRIAQLERHLYHADLVRVYSRPLFERTRRFNPRVMQVLPCIDMLPFPTTLPPRRDARLKLTYVTGRGAGDPLIALFADDLQRLLDTYPQQVEMTWWGAAPERFRDHPASRELPVNLDYDQFLHTLATEGFDVGLAPLIPTPFNLAKTNTKFRDYGACHMAGIYSDVAVYSQCVQHERTGLLVSDAPGAWFEAMQRLVLDSTLRDTLRTQAYAYIDANYRQEFAEVQWAETIGQLLAQRRVHGVGLLPGAPAAADVLTMPAAAPPVPSTGTLSGAALRSSAPRSRRAPSRAGSGVLRLRGRTNSDPSAQDAFVARRGTPSLGHKRVLRFRRAAQAQGYLAMPAAVPTAAAVATTAAELGRLSPDSLDSLCLEGLLDDSADPAQVLAAAWQAVRHGGQVALLAPYRRAPGYLDENSPHTWSSSAAPIYSLQAVSGVLGEAAAAPAEPAFDLRCFELAFFDAADYVHLSQSERHAIRARRPQICQYILYHCLVVKQPLDEAQLAARLAALTPVDPPRATAQRMADRRMARKRILQQAHDHLAQLEQQLAERDLLLAQRDAELGWQMPLARLLAQQVDAYRNRGVVRVLTALRDRSDYAQRLSPNYRKLADDSLLFAGSLRGYRLRHSLSLTRVPFLAYNLLLPRPGLSEVWLAPVFDLFPRAGQMGVEIVAGGKVVAQALAPAAGLLADTPLGFSFSPLPAAGPIEVRVFGRDLDVPLQLYEWQQPRRLGLGRPLTRPFCGLSFVTPA